MSTATIEVNPNATLKVLRVGREGTPVIVIDEFARDTGAIIDFACTSVDYGPDTTSAYPGLRANLPREYVITVLNTIFRFLFKVYSVPMELSLRPQNTVYSLITIPEKQLLPAQCVPHYDSNGPWYLAILHYLNPGDFCATGLFRHRPTGFERITEERLGEFRSTSEEFAREHGEPPQRYITGSTEHFELYHQIEYRPNRLVVYPGNLLHSGLVDPGRDIDANPRTGRLTANIFVDFEPPANP